MNKQTIIRYLNNELTDTEKAVLFRWIEASEGNRSYFNAIKNLWTVGSLNADTEAQPDFSDLKERIAKLVVRPKPYTIIVRRIIHTAAMLALPLAAGVFWLAAERGRHTPLVQEDNPNIIVYTPLCTKAEVCLPDGTRVWLNSGSRISYPRLFAGNTRVVALEGEAYFDVKENRNFPFLVKTPHKLTVNVTGTAFNLRAYPDDRELEATLVHGTIELKGENTQAVYVKPKQSIRYENANNAFFVKSEVNTELYTAWKEGTLVFDNISIYDMAKRLERWYGVSIAIESRQALHFSYTGKFREETIGQVLELIRRSSTIGYRMEDKSIALFVEE